MSSAQKVKLESLDSLLGLSVSNVKIKTLPLSALEEFENHPFLVTENEAMEELIASIKENGILEPIIVRPKNGKYEICAGHRRTYAAGKAGLKEVPVDIRNLNDAEATRLMVDSNIYRPELLPSERAFAYKLLRDAKLGGAESIQVENEGSSAEMRKMQRYIRLTYLIPSILLWVDQKKLTMDAGISLSFIPAAVQEWIVVLAKRDHIYPTAGQAKEIRRRYENMQNQMKFEDLLELFTKPVNKRELKFRTAELQEFFPEGMAEEEMKKFIIDMLRKHAI